MEILLASVGIFTLYNLINTKKETFQDTFFDSESYLKTRQANDNVKNNNILNNPTVNTINIINEPNNPLNRDFQLPVNNVSEPEPELTLQDFIQKNSLYNKDTINGVPLRDYFNEYSKKVLSSNSWVLAKDLPSETSQYIDNSEVQQKMEIFTGERQRRDRTMLGVPTKRETENLFTPAEKTTGYGYQYGTNGSGPGALLSRTKELESYSNDIKFKTNEKPFEQIIVGKGIGLDADVPASGGFQEYTRVLPENISDYKANQLPGRVAGGKWIYSNAPTSQVPVVKNRPNGFYSMCTRGPATGKSTITAESIRPDTSILLRNQNRQHINYGFGTSSLDSFLCK